MVSGIITTYKREAATVRRAIDSMLAQTYPLAEIIVVDDNENDSPLCKDLLALCRENDKVRYIKQNGNKGACAARNLGIESAKGKYIAFLDDDDLWLPKKIENQIRVLESEPLSVGMVYCCGFLLNEDTGEKSDYYNAEIFRERVGYEDMLYYDYVGTTSQPLIRKECFDKAGGFWVEQPARQDYEMWIRISKFYDIVGIPDRLFIHTIHNDAQISKGVKRSHAGHVNIYKRYKKDIDRNFVLREQRLHCIVETGVRSKEPDTLYYGALWLWTIIRNKIFRKN